jgi:DNA-binding NarL/FixJ family response regulator
MVAFDAAVHQRRRWDMHDRDDDDDVRAWKIRVADGIFAVISLPAPGGAALPELTAAEHAVVEHIVRGDSNKQIAAHRGRSVRTVANQIAAVFQKLRVASRAELIVLLSGMPRR